MPYVQLPKQQIRITIPDLTVGDTIIKREAYASRMEYDIDGERVLVNWIVQHFANDNGNKGEYLGNYIPDYVRPNIANNQTMCDITTGIPVEADADGNYPDNVNYTGQFDFFLNMGETTPIVVNSVIKQFGLAIVNWNK